MTRYVMWGISKEAHMSSTARSQNNVKRIVLHLFIFLVLFRQKAKLVLLDANLSILVRNLVLQVVQVLLQGHKLILRPIDICRKLIPEGANSPLGHVFGFNRIQPSSTRDGVIHIQSQLKVLASRMLTGSGNDSNLHCKRIVLSDQTLCLALSFLEPFVECPLLLLKIADLLLQTVLIPPQPVTLFNLSLQTGASCGLCPNNLL